MTKSAYIAAAAMLLAVASQVSAGDNPEDLNKIAFRNASGEPIRHIFVSPSDSQNPTADILGIDRDLADRESVTFYIDYPDDCGEFDITAIGWSGLAYSIREFEICDDSTAAVRFGSRNLGGMASDLEMVELLFENRTNIRIEFIYFPPSDSEVWGIDQLDWVTTLDPGESASLLMPATEEVVHYDLLAVDVRDNGYSYNVRVDNSHDQYVLAVEPRHLTEIAEAED